MINTTLIASKYTDIRICWTGAGIEIVKTLSLVCLYKDIPIIQATILQRQVQHR